MVGSIKKSMTRTFWLSVLCYSLHWSRISSGLKYVLYITGDVCDLVSKASSTSKPSSKDKGLKSESCHGLNVVGLRVGEGIRRAERDLTRLRESLSRHVRGSPTYTIIFSKIEEKQEELDKLRASERSVDLERNQRKDCKKLTVF